MKSCLSSNLKFRAVRIYRNDDSFGTTIISTDYINRAYGISYNQRFIQQLIRNSTKTSNSIYYTKYRRFVEKSRTGKQFTVWWRYEIWLIE